MQLDAPMQLRVLIPAVENSVDGHAYRPGDVIASRKGITVEIGNTDAEGRLVLADALAEADAEKPDLLIDLATLTGAARVALGPGAAGGVLNRRRAARALARDRRRGDGSGVADAAVGRLRRRVLEQDRRHRQRVGGSLRRLADRGAVPQALRHRDAALAARRPVRLESARSGPGRPVGAEAQCVRSVYRLIRARCA